MWGGDVIWNTSKVSKTREVTVMAKAHTDVDILRMKVAAFDDTRYTYYCSIEGWGVGCELLYGTPARYQRLGKLLL